MITQVSVKLCEMVFTYCLKLFVLKLFIVYNFKFNNISSRLKDSPQLEIFKVCSSIYFIAFLIGNNLDSSFKFISEQFYKYTKDTKIFNNIYSRIQYYDEKIQNRLQQNNQ